MGDEEEAPKGYINTNVKVDNVKKHIRAVLVNLFFLWAVRASVSSRSDYASAGRTVLSFENRKFLGTKESMVGFARRRSFNYEILDATSKIQDRVFMRTPRDKKFMVAVLLGIFCSVTTARLVEEHLETVLAARALKQAVEAVAKHSRRAYD